MTDTKLQIRISVEEKVRWQRESEALGLTLTDYIKKKVNDGVMTEGEEVVMTEDKEDITEDVPTMDSKWGGKPIFKDEKLNKEFYDD